MSKKFRKPIAAWYFYLNNNETNMSTNTLAHWNFGIFSQTLQILREEELFIPIQIMVSISNVQKERIETKNLNNFEVLFLLSDLLNKYGKESLSFTGKTLIKSVEGDYWEESIIGFSYEFYYPRLAIEIFSDLWVPIDRDMNLQIDLAELNAGRLTRTLKRIKNLGFNEIVPDEGEDYTDEIFKQRGFQLYINEFDIYLNIDEKIFDKVYVNGVLHQLNEYQIQIINKYLWSNRHNKND
jgi:hypothetical protein